MFVKCSIPITWGISSFWHLVGVFVLCCVYTYVWLYEQVRVGIFGSGLDICAPIGDTVLCLAQGSCRGCTWHLLSSLWSVWWFGHLCEWSWVIFCMTCDEYADYLTNTHNMNKTWGGNRCWSREREIGTRTLWCDSSSYARRGGDNCKDGILSFETELCHHGGVLEYVMSQPANILSSYYFSLLVN